MRFPQLMPPLVALLLLGLGGWRLSRYIASQHQSFQSREFSQNHPLLMWLGPDQSAAQNGYTLVAVQDLGLPLNYHLPNGNGAGSFGGDPMHRGDTALWIRRDNLPPSLPAFDSSTQFPRSRLYTVTGRTSTGGSFPLPWEWNGGQPQMSFLRVSIPAGYPNTVQWVAVTVNDPQGNQASWRISHLPPMQHQIVPQVAGQNIYNKGGVHVSFAAWRAKGPHAPVIRWRLRGRISPFQHEWDIETRSNEQWEWGGGQTANGNSSAFYGFGLTGHCDVTGTIDPSATGGTPLPYLHDQHFIRFFATMHQRDRASEIVTFHNVPLRKNGAGSWCIAPRKPLTLTSPSGITVTLPDVSQDRINGLPVRGPGIWYRLDASPHTAVSLPKSRLWRAYRQPVDVFVSPKPAEGYRDGGGEGDGHTQLNFLTGAIPVSARFADFAVSVEQQVPLKTIPMTFTVPIGDHP